MATAFEGSEALGSFAGASYFDVVYNTVVFVEPRLQLAMMRLIDTGRKTARHLGIAGEMMGRIVGMDFSFRYRWGVLRAVRQLRRLLPRRHRDDEGSVTSASQGAAGARQDDGADAASALGAKASHEQAAGVHPGASGARRVDVAQAVRDLMVAVVSRTDARHHRAGLDSDAAAGGRLHEAAGNDLRRPRRQVPVLVRADRHGSRARGAAASHCAAACTRR
ncbi:MAG: hypothetical protein IAE86_19955 [Burkholderiaceae bacterium]|nr:hypothetical protein [Burkholderiaceae bacterium]